MGEVYTRVGPETLYPLGGTFSNGIYKGLPALGCLPSPGQNYVSSVLLFHFRNILSGDGPRQIERCAPSLF